MSSAIDTRAMMANAKFYEAYSRFIPEKNRYETWEESVHRVMQMHREKYKGVMNKELERIFADIEEAYNQKLFLGAQRALQFGGEQLMKHQIRLYNCVSSYADRAEFFGEFMYMLLCGAGAGFSVQYHHIVKLSRIENTFKEGSITCYIQDSIEGWADAIDVLMSSYFEDGGKHPRFSNHVVNFDYSQIRPKGSFISGGFKAPGAEPLKNCIELIRSLLNKLNGKKLDDIDVYDICMYIADAVIAGGVRRSATICLFSKNSEKMMNAKTGNWFFENPQRGRSNNSAVLVRSETTFEEFENIMKSVKDFGEPGFIFTDSTEFTYNPCVEIGKYPINDEGHTGWQGCVSYDTKLITKQGIKVIGEAVDNKEEIEIWNGQKWSKVKPIQTGENRKLFRVNLSDGSYLDCTSNHKWLVKTRFEKEFKEVETKDLDLTKYALQVPRTNIKYCEDDSIYENKAYDYGFILGDGTCYTRLSGKLRNPQAQVHKCNFDLNFPFISGVIGEVYDHPSKNEEYYTVTFKVDNQLAYDLKYNKGLPQELFSWDRASIKDFFAGWIDTDGSITSNNKVRVYGEESKIRDGQLLLSKHGINSSVNLMQKKGIETNKGIRNRDVWYLQISDTQDLYCTKANLFATTIKAKGKFQIIRSIEELDGLHNSYCFEESELHQGVFANVLTKQCNLTEINGAKSNTKEDFYFQCYVASAMGTLQAGYTDFKFLSPNAKEIFEKEALIGVGITGWMNNPDVLFDEEVMRTGARIVKDTNKRVAKLIGINPAARTTCVKPSGNASVLLGTASGIHGEHSKNYIRHVQFNKDTQIAKLFVDKNPQMVEESVWSKNKTDIAVAFPITTPKGSIYKKDLLGIKQLEYVKRVQECWVEEGTNIELCRDSRIRHNVSNTITVDDWEEVTKYVYENRFSFCGISFLAASGDKAYPQAPNTEVLEMQDIINKYGEVALYTSALIEHGLSAFNQDLWSATSTALGYGQDISEINHANANKREWVRRFNKFAKHFKNAEQCTECLKDVYNLHKVWRIKNSFEPIDWTKINKQVYTDIDTTGAVACSGGRCEI